MSYRRKSEQNFYCTAGNIQIEPHNFFFITNRLKMSIDQSSITFITGYRTLCGYFITVKMSLNEKSYVALLFA